MSESRIPKLADTSRKVAVNWLTSMHGKGLLSCLQDLAFDVVSKTFHTRKERSQFKAMYG